LEAGAGGAERRGAGGAARRRAGRGPPAGARRAARRPARRVTGGRGAKIDQRKGCPAAQVASATAGIDYRLAARPVTVSILAIRRARLTGLVSYSSQP